MSEYWEINGVETDGFTGPQSGMTPGETQDFAFLFRPRGTGTLEHIDRYEQIRKLTEYAGNFDTFENIVHEFYFMENRESDSTPSPLVHIVPPDNSLVAREVWGLIDGYDDQTMVPKRRCPLTLSVKLLFIGSDFTDETAFRSAREVAGL